MQDKLKEQVELNFKAYFDVNKIVVEKNKLIQNKQTDLKTSLEGKSLEDMQDILVYTYVDTILYNKELQFLFVKAINTIEIFKQVSDEKLSDEIENFYKEMKQWMPKRMFAVEKDDLVEVETGILEKERKAFLEGDFFQRILEKTQTK